MAWVTEEQWEWSLTDAAWGFLFSEPNRSVRVVLLGRHKREEKKKSKEDEQVSQKFYRKAPKA